MAEPKITRRKITDYIPDMSNANAGTERGLQMVEDSLSQDGVGRSIVADARDRIPAGNKTLEAAMNAGIEDVIEIETDGHALIVHKRTDWDLTDPQGAARRYAYRDNRASEVSLNWDAEQLLADINAGVDLSHLFTAGELDELLAGLQTDEPPGDPGAAIERAEQLVEQYGVVRGQLWLLGRHRVMCGSSYDSEHVARLLDGIEPDMLHTDPPYGINAVNAHFDGKGLTSATKNLPPGFARRGSNGQKVTDAAERSVGATGAMRSASRTALIVQPNLYPVIEGDDHPFDPSPFLDLAPIIVLWGANNYADKLPISRAWITWDKREAITRNDFSDCELAWCNIGNVSRCFHHLWNGLHKGSQHGERRTHPTEKPVALFEEIGKMYADKGVWVDLFAGTGAQLVAAERSGATCVAMEYEPLYVATILDRLERMGITPRLSE